jgi:membrane associated rhomboid family serine protease
MGLHDRPYWRDDGGGDWRGGGLRHSLAFGLPKPTKAVKYLLIMNGVVFLVQILFLAIAKESLGDFLGASVDGFWQVWRYITFQFLHSTSNIFHLALNMLGLYMLGTPLEQHWGTRRFVRFYLSCGATAGVVYVIASRLLMPPWAWGYPLIGASGGVFGIVLACAVFFPQFRLILIFFPVPIRLAAIIIFGGMILLVLTTLAEGGYGNPGFWSHVAHLGGAGAAAVWIWALPRLRGAASRSRVRRSQGAWKRKMQKRQAAEEEIDRILKKIKDEGIASLSRTEKKILQDATRRQQAEDRDLLRM